jgi:hypothetical protein
MGDSKSEKKKKKKQQAAMVNILPISWNPVLRPKIKCWRGMYHID